MIGPAGCAVMTGAAGNTPQPLSPCGTVAETPAASPDLASSATSHGGFTLGDPMRGIHTSEFWLTLVTILCLTFLVSIDKVSVEIALGLLGASGIYTASRGVAKLGGLSRGARPPAKPAGGPGAPDAGTAKHVVTLCLALQAITGLIITAGCSSTQVAPGHDAFVVEAEKDIRTAFHVVDAFLQWEERNRPVVGEEVTNLADDLRVQFPAYLASAQDVLRAYKRSRTPEGRADVVTWLQTVQSAMLAAVRHLPPAVTDSAIVTSNQH